MKADSIHFKGHSCFKNDWAGFDEIKPINVIIGRNNSGKSHLLDLVEALCDGKLFDREWKYQFGGVLEEEPLRRAFSFGPTLDRDPWRNHGQYFVGKAVTWESSVSGGPPSQKEVSNVKFPDDLYLTDPHQFQEPPPQFLQSRKPSPTELIDARISRIT